MLAPVILFVYNRPIHTRKTLTSLARNNLAKESKLFIFSDDSKNSVQENNVKEVRAIIEEKEWLDFFKTVKIIKRSSNMGLANSVISGVTNLINQFDTAIVLEDDLIVSPYFLKYMNEALNYYENDSKIWSISGFNIPIQIPKHYKEDIYLSYRASSWGWATWKNRWEKVDWDITDYSTFKTNRKNRNKFNRGGRDLSYMLDAQMNNKIDSWAIRWCYAQSKLDSFTIYPIKSLVSNTGLDGSGTHSDYSKRYNNNLNTAESVKLTQITTNNKLLRKFKAHYLSYLKYLAIELIRSIRKFKQGMVK
ncbi:sugar transferase [Carnobacterium sp. AT7]|uniref:glycosyltransferase n=1 Tax=Carnobacterium sp. AT7 TaxID=333990 RepID=UPI00015F16F3|nr:glycosyltransferase [Carnobacterium sp. AT7]EDP68084.1 sugar transferase [Carnobacterium sp. AT7]